MSATTLSKQQPTRAARLLEATRKLSDRLEEQSFSPPVHSVYNPLVYAAIPGETYVTRYASSKKRVLFLGMNPGPWGMAQTGVPFGEISTVRDWMGIEDEVHHPRNEHPKRVIEGFGCTRSEVSGRRFWGLMRDRFPVAENFFSEHYVANYCPLIFLESSGRNRTPEKLPRDEREALYRSCDEFLLATIEILEPEWLVGVGKFAETRLASVASCLEREFAGIVSITHPSPANPRANRGWGRPVTEALVSYGVWGEENLE